MTFKAKWEKTHTRINLPEDIIFKMLGSCYTEESNIKKVSIIDGGCANINVLVHLNDSVSPVLLRVYLRDQNSADIEQKISSLLQGKLPVPKFYNLSEGFGYKFAITEYLPGQTLRDLLLSDKKNDISNIMHKVGKALGEISRIKFSNSGFFNNALEVESNLSAEGLANFCFQCLENNKVRTILSQEQISQIQNIFKTHKHLLPNGTESNLVHGDFDPANILVCHRNGQLEISGILDWEFSFSGSTLCDVANMLRYAHFMPNDYQESFLQGLVSNGYELPNSWKITVNLLNIVSLLDCLVRSDPVNRPNQIKDIKQLLSYITELFVGKES